uniref:Fibronectin type-III domain-containing protein n=1 Tax=Oryzias sinensis TaxID=183150 RepID=A0A8C7WPU8_9TELE
MLKSEHWIGLRKYFPNISNTDGSTWIQWANGDPVVFQNWHPDMPVSKFPLPKIDCCSCSCTCPVTTAGILSTIFTTEPVTNFTSVGTGVTKSPPLNATCERAPIFPPVIPETNKLYIEDSCVVMLRFGLWAERNCTDKLPFICYEDKFIGRVDIACNTSQSAFLKWQPGPGNVEYYQVEIKGEPLSQQPQHVLDLSLSLDGLIGGNYYEVNVSAVKCQRFLNPQLAYFYTVPNKVKDLRVHYTTDTSIFLRWDKPDGNVSMYLVKTETQQREVNATELDFNGLMPGTCFTFTVLSGVQDRSKWSEGSVVSNCTRPGKVSNLNVYDVTNNKLTLRWNKPNGNFAGFFIKVTSRNTTQLLHANQSETEKIVTALPSGSYITIEVRVKANSDVMGDATVILAYTVPEPVLNLKLQPGNKELTVTWSYSDSADVTFTAKLWKDDKFMKNASTTEKQIKFQDLKSATNYTVQVYAVSGTHPGIYESASEITLPGTPLNIRATNMSTNNITLEWDAPDGITKATYIVNFTNFWGDKETVVVVDNTKYEFTKLKSGTRYFYEVYNKAGSFLSLPAIYNVSTDPVKMEITLSMLCSSPQSLLCADVTQKKLVLKQVTSQNILGKITTRKQGLKFDFSCFCVAAT